VDIVEKIDGLRAEIGRDWARYRTAFDRVEGDSHRPALSSHRSALSIGWDDACRRWQASIDRLNKEIDSYNLKRPPGQAEIIKLRLADELRRVDAPRYLL
jgi:hypothetical protein